MRSITMIMAAIMVAGCGSTTSRVARLETIIAEQRELIASLQAERLTGVHAESTDDDADGETATPAAPATPPPATAAAPASRPMPPFATMPMTPQHWGNMHGGPPMAGGMCSGVLTLHIVNQTDHFITVLLDGRAVQVGGGAGILPHLPPRQEVEVCLTSLGRHTISGTLYAVRGRQVVDLGVRFSRQVSFGTNTTPWAFQRYAITDSIIRRGRLP